VKERKKERKKEERKKERKEERKKIVVQDQQQCGFCNLPLCVKYHSSIKSTK
jgi:hypothetical protein